MPDAAPEKHSPDHTSNAPASHHRQTSTIPTSKQRSQSKSRSPAPNKKRKREGSEASHAGASPSETANQQLTSSSTATASRSQRADKSGAAVSAPQVSSSSIGRSPLMASVKPIDGQTQGKPDCSDDPESSPPGAQGGDGESSTVWRSREKLAACLACDLCHEVLKDPVTAPECMHSFCRDCIDQHVLYGGTKNICPVCKATDLQTVFGPQPFQHGKLQFDPMLADMIRKLFPRAAVEKSILERQDAEAKFRASLLPAKKAKPGPAKTPLHSASAHAHAHAAAPAAASLPAQAASLLPVSGNAHQTQAGPVATARVGVFLQTVDSQMQLALPYLWVQQGLSVKSLGSYVSSQLRLDCNLFQLGLECEGSVLQLDLTMHSVWRQWVQTHSLQDLVIIQVRIQQKPANSPPSV